MMRPVQRPRKEQGERTRQTIIDVTARLFAERGYAGTSLDLVAKEADTSKSSIFWHFQNKEDLLFTVVDQALSVWESRAGDEVLAQPTPPLRFAKLLDLHRELAEEHPHTVRLLLGLLLETADGDEAIRIRFQRIYEGYRRSAAHILEAGMRDGSFSAKHDPNHLAVIFLAVHDGVFMQRFLDSKAVDVGVYETLADALFALVTPNKPRPRP
ncbi:MAG: TetR/AcrR family transcriptional regulator [Myxococcota bacterium]